MSQLPGSNLNPVAAGGLTGQPVLSAGVIQGALDGGYQTLGTLISKVLQSIQAGITAGMQTLGQLHVNIATPIVQGLNAGQSTIDSIGTTVQQSIGAQLASSPPSSGAGGTASQGVVPGQYAWNLYAVRGIDQTPGVSHWASVTIQSTGAGLLTGDRYCFVGGYAEFLDAYAKSQDGSLLPADGACPSPGGSASPPVGAPPPPPPPPPPPITPATCDPANNVPPFYVVEAKSGAGSPVCGVYDSLCYGDVVGNIPGSSVVGGPYATFNEAEAALLQICNAGGPPPPPTCPSGQTYDPTSGTCITTPVTPPPPPPPCQCITFQADACLGVRFCSSGGCDMKIDLCDWSKFTKALVDALCQWYDKCVCRLSNETDYQVKDCDGDLGSTLQNFLGDTGSGVYGASSLDDLVNNATNLFQT